ncbi:hypothetical protein M2152_000390 [Microbacteriaceae bacterium SG_E_30_P1]|uniref:Galactosyltransferase C-terminal domain-containing protein n=1 Tax=Antiquaquibacter oligotrophicus TaxID=2880260 RepID=A0ABT6KJR5_9MICO|nr:hypothetical protein [Antiquaquibacter oligotrophicus]MDH6180208.1 hypothetical protein [Antiquaquibacter oligotrophicus]UDF14045.1 hypothetical protein LH407_04075 [Antiquaquibacter oligotrophicus]
MPLTVLIPWRPKPSRVAAFDAVVAWYRENLGDVNIRAVDTDDEVFNLARCRNVGVASVVDPDSVVIINDADTIPEKDALLDAIAQAATSGRVHLPYTQYHWLGASGTAQLLAGTPAQQCDHEVVLGACSGVYVTTPTTWWSHGGQDERFRGWGFEDAAWNLAHETLLGELPRRHYGHVFALHHVAELREGPNYDANAALMELYREAASSPESMLQLVTASRARLAPGA